MRQWIHERFLICNRGKTCKGNIREQILFLAKPSNDIDVDVVHGVVYYRKPHRNYNKKNIISCSCKCVEIDG